jgi:hypothetical protein
MLIGIRVTCAVCGLTKKPIGRSAPLACAGGLCDYECPGYRAEPYVGSLWPGESAEDFGYPIGTDGTVDRT